MDGLTKVFCSLKEKIAQEHPKGATETQVKKIAKEIPNLKVRRNFIRWIKTAGE